MVTFLLPEATVILAVPDFLAVRTPLLDTDTIDLLEEEYFTFC